MMMMRTDMMMHNIIPPLAPFVPEWLQMTRGADVTDLVHTHHLDESKVDAILKKYYVTDVKHPNTNIRYTFKDEGFYMTLKRRVATKIREMGGSGPTWLMTLSCTVTLLLWLAAFAMMVMDGRWWWAVVGGYFLNSVFGVGHNYMHKAPTLWRYCVDLTAFSHRDWMISHCISHHTFPNLELDYEMQILEPFVYSMYNQPTNPWLFRFYWPLLGTIPGYTETIIRWWYIFQGKAKFRIEYLLVLLQWAILMYAHGWLWGTALWLMMHGVFSSVLTTTTLAVHHSDFGWSEGMQGGLVDFGEHTMISTHVSRWWWSPDMMD